MNLADAMVIKRKVLTCVYSGPGVALRPVAAM